MRDPVYHIEQLRHFYGDSPVLSVDGLDIREASIVGLAGPNGSGKSTLLRLLGFIEKPTEGLVLYAGQPEYPFSESVRFNVTLMPQEPYLLKRSVFNNVAYGLKIRGDSEVIRRQKVHQALEWVGLSPEKFSPRPWNALSGGEAQRVALAARLVLKPRVLLLDEPTASIDANSALRIREAAVMARSSWETSIVIASHDWQWLGDTCDRVLHMYNGRLLGEGLQNLLPGPWEKGSTRWTRNFEDGQDITLSPPDFKADAAVLDPGKIEVSLAPPTEAAGMTNLTGRLVRLTADNHSGNLVAAVLIGAIAITAKMSKAEIGSEQMVPGQEVWLQFDNAAVRWV